MTSRAGAPGQHDAPEAARARDFYAAVERGDWAGAELLQQQFRRGEPSLPVDASSKGELALLPWDRDFAPANDDRFLFVSGPPRSGTTALGKLLRLHPRVLLYIEAFAPWGGYLPAMFAPANLRTLAERGLLPSLERPLNVETLARTPKRPVVGDKRPNFMASAGLTLANFAGRRVSVVHLVRRIEDVVASYLQRVENGSFPANYDHRTAVEHANMNNHRAVEVAGSLRPGHDLIVVGYESFWTSVDHADRLLRRLDLNPAKADRSTLARMFADAARIRGRARPLSDEVRRTIAEHYDREAEREVRALALW